MSLEYATGLDVGVRKRRRDGINEDSVAVNLLEDGHLDVTRNAGVFVLADGAGGEEAGSVASYIATVEVARRLTTALWEGRTFENAIDAESTPGQRPLDERAVTATLHDRGAEWVLNRIETAIRSTHTRLLQRIQDLGLGNAYTTIVAGVKLGSRFYYGWVGDSRAYVVNRHPQRAADRQLSLLTRDHSIVRRLLERGEIDEIEAHVHRKGNRITRALGGGADDDPAGSSVQVETGQVRLYADDVVLLTSDGLIDAYADAPRLHRQYQQANATADIEDEILDKSVTDDEIRDVILAADSLSTAADRCLALANRRGGKDNLSLVLFRDGGLDPSPTDGLPDRTYEPGDDPLGSQETIVRDRDQ